MIITITMVKEKYAEELISKIGGEICRSYDGKIDIQFINLKGISVEITPRYLIVKRKETVVRIPSTSYHGMHMIKEPSKNFMNKPE